MPSRARSAGFARVTSRPSYRIWPRLGAQELGQEVEHRGLAGAVRPDQGVDRAAPDPQVDVLHGGKARELLGQLAGLDDEIVHAPSLPLAPDPPPRLPAASPLLLGCNALPVKWPSCRTRPWIGPKRHQPPESRAAPRAHQVVSFKRAFSERSSGIRKIDFGSRPAYRRLPIAGPLYSLPRFEHLQMSALSLISVVLRLGSLGQGLAMSGRIVKARSLTQNDGPHPPAERDLSPGRYRCWLTRWPFTAAAKYGDQATTRRAAAKNSSSVGNFSRPARPSVAPSILTQRTMPSRSTRNWP